MRTDPRTEQKVIVTKQKAEEIDRQWRVFISKDSLMREFLIGISTNEIEQSIKELSERFGHKADEIDAVWKILNERLVKHAIDWNWGLYSIVRYQMGKVLQYENKFLEALKTNLEVIYLDQNGANNCGHMKKYEQKLRPEFSRITPNLCQACNILYLQKFFNSVNL